MKKLYNLKMKEESNMSNHLNEFNTLINQIISVNINLDDEIKAISLLCSLPHSWEGVVMAISNSVYGKKGSVLKFDDVVRTLFVEDMRRKNQGTSSGDTLMARNRGRSQEDITIEEDQSLQEIEVKRQK